MKMSLMTTFLKFFEPAPETVEHEKIDTEHSINNCESA